MMSALTKIPLKSFFLIVLLAFGASAANSQPAQMGVSPSRFDLDLDDVQETHSFRVFNYGDKSMTVNLAINNWDLDQEGKVRLLPPTEQSLDQWILINPVRFQIGAKDSQLVRFAVRPRVKPTPGEHRAIIYLNQVNGDESKEGVRFGFRVGMAIYGTVGDVERRGELHKILAGSGGAEFDISSLGNANVRLSGEFALWSAEDFPGTDVPTRLVETNNKLSVPEGALQAGYLPGRPILPGARRNVALPLPNDLKPGEYVLEMNGALGDSPLDRTFRFTVTEANATATTVAGGGGQ